MKENLQQLLERARADASFFHALVFDPDKAAKSIEDRELKAAIYGINPERLIGSIIHQGIGLQWCDGTCGSASCIDTCGPRSCGRTCDDSCGTTCSHSCGDTTKFSRLGDRVNPAAGLGGIAGRFSGER